MKRKDPLTVAEAQALVNSNWSFLAKNFIRLEIKRGLKHMRTGRGKQSKIVIFRKDLREYLSALNLHSKYI